MIALVRHAAAGVRGSFADDAARPLTLKGRLQANAIAADLGSLKFTRVLSSGYLRCRQTVEPLARARGLEVEVAAVLAEGHRAASLLPLLLRVGAAGAVLCSHGDVIADLVAHLVDQGLIPAGDARFPKASTWLIEMRRGAIAGARYLPPPEVARASPGA